ncbi:Transcriptional regulatory protein SrrA [Jeotgalibaca dankookensis]|uniref:Transcriptional regulatory protein SrrA n=1 Tax=Jeotgalibaca dankookensis TaxID=708126 RepID=A0A1S6ILN0_9LACT|nr:response regulator transcription factor [Jeotgalibaca dankookensis]AQS52447.1 Transcriptional regulatory protein SrrA [Jeotgalibaca dankookensis]
MNILMIEDNEAVCEMMAMFFEKEEWQATFSGNGEKGLTIFLNDQEKWDMVILDLNLPGMDGMQVCREIRKVSLQVPIIMLTARDSESDQVIGLEIGADEYVTKPFSPLTLMARMKALYRRSQLGSQTLVKEENPFDIQTRVIQMSTVTRDVYYQDKKIDGLTPKEFEILALLAAHPKQVFSREHLLNRIWEEPFFGDERTIDAHIKKLRQKIEVVGPQVIHTVWGVGYKFDDTGIE